MVEQHIEGDHNHGHKHMKPEEAMARLGSYHKEHGHFYQPGKHLWARIGRVAMAGTGFLADSYDLFVINLALMMMKQNNYIQPLDPDTKTRISIMAIVGALSGQVLFGVMGDSFGRKVIFATTAFLTIFGTLLQAMIQPNNYFTIWQQMMLFRYVMGLGVGGEYPMASTVTSEASEMRHRGRNLACVFSMQGVGRVLCAVVLMFSSFVITDTNMQWRFAIIMGAVPMMIAAYFRLRMHESEIYVKDVGQISPAKRAKVILGMVWANRWKLMGTAGSWFILDVLFYGNSLFSADVTDAMGTGKKLTDQTTANLIIQLIAMPGYIAGIWMIDLIGRKRLQLFGFAGEAIVFSIMAAFQLQLRGMPKLFLFLYALTFFFDDCGPNLTTFVIPAEIYPTEARATCHGISAAFGKAGAAVGGSLFLKMANMYCPGKDCTHHKKTPESDKGLRQVFWICAGLALLGFIWTIMFVQDKPHESLKKVESIYDVEPVHEGEIAELEMIAAEKDEVKADQGV